VLQIGNGLGAPLALPGRLIRTNANGSQTVMYE